MLRWSGLAAALLVLGAPLANAEWISVSEHGPLDFQVLESSDVRTVVEIRVGGFERQPVAIDGQTYYRLSLVDESASREVGAPELPNVRRSLVIPDDARMSVRVIEEEFTDVGGTRVVPARGAITRNVNPEAVPYVFGSTYDEGGWYPSETASLGEPYILRDLRGVVVRANVLRYDASTETVRVTTRLVLEVTPVGPGEVNTIEREGRPTNVDAEFARLYGSQFENYDQLRYTPTLETGSMLVITYDDFETAMGPLTNWKNQCGIRCECVTRTTAGNTATAIKSFIQNYYDTQGLTYVLLVGDDGQLPTQFAFGGGSDPSYSLLAGNDSYPDIFVGRVSAQNEAQVQTQIERFLAYEGAPVLADDWFGRGTGIASNEGPGDDGEWDFQHMDNIRTDLLNFTYTAVDQIYDPGANASQVTVVLNEGRSIVNYCGHGSRTSWGTTGFSSSHVNSLTNVDRLPFIISVACVNGQFTGGTCFAEAWLRATHDGQPSGAVGAYMSSINQSWSPPMCAQDEINDLLVGEVMETYGGLCFNGSSQMIDEYGSDGVEMFRTWNIFGDPSLMVRTMTPAPLTVSHDAIILPDAVTFSVLVDGLVGARCALSYEGAYLGSALTDVTGEAIIPVEGQLPLGESVMVTVTAANHLPYVGAAVVGDVAIPAMILDPESFLVEVPIGGSEVEYLTITNTGELGSMLDFEVTVMGDGPMWLSVTPTSGSVPQGGESIVELAINAGGLLPGIHERSLLIEPNFGLDVTVPVTLAIGGVAVDVTGDGGHGAQLVLRPNQPNPVDTQTWFDFATPRSGYVRLDVFDAGGRRVAAPVAGMLAAGDHRIAWNATDPTGSRLPAGVYYYRLTTAGGQSRADRLLILR